VRDFACVFAQSFSKTEPHRYLWFYDPAALQAGLASLWANLDLNEKLAADFRRVYPGFWYQNFWDVFHDAAALQALATELDVRIDRESYETQLCRLYTKIQISRPLVLDAAVLDVTLTYSILP
jgi:hypothetical protein